MNKHVVMNGDIIKWADSVGHLGNFVDKALSDYRYNHSMFNVFVYKFGHLQRNDPYLLYI